MKITNTSCATRCVASTDASHRRFPVKIDLIGLHMQTVEEVVHHFCGMDFVCESCRVNRCPELIFEITGLASNVSQDTLDTLAFRIHEIFERRFKILQVFMYNDEMCGFYKTTHFENSERAAHVA